MKILAMGDSALMDGFALIGIQTYADQSVENINSILSELRRRRERALVFIQQDLMGLDIPMIRYLRNRGGMILICEIPKLGQAEHYQPAVERLIEKVLGSAVLEHNNGQ